ncbi:DNA binding domain-containing protein, excisionase family [Selenomonas ruminantium]|uniref:DNA binding domain-containing protein, excisionase family n=1 Tax=Selenomonas ruminantium TaxID=971 RepID=A0A1M6WXG4_SELRU|nr:helix-turn-helix domain-containing protein [Selenomonas ruminantium]SHK98462.1 DNA binding domain-containing protein, excisionase family [Selenomonas ruminantium]
MKVEKNILTVAEAACILSCSPHVIYRLIHSNALGAFKDAEGRPWRIPESCIKDYVASRMSNATSLK